MRLGEHNLLTDPDCEQTQTGRVCAAPLVRVPVEKVISHKEYKASDPDKHNDIGIIRLRSNVPFTGVFKLENSFEFASWKEWILRKENIFSLA